MGSNMVTIPNFATSTGLKVKGHNSMKERYEICELGIERIDYFQGFGAALTDFDAAMVGVGDSTQEAYDNLLEQFYASESPEQAAYLDLPEELPIDNEELTSEDYDADMYVFVGLLYNIVPQNPGA